MLPKLNATPTPEQTAAAQAIIDQSATSLIDRTTVLDENEPATTVQSLIPAELVEDLTTIFIASMANPDFFRNPKRAERLKEALVVPMFDDRSMQQFAISAREELTRLAMNTAIKQQIVPVMPTDEEIAVLAKKKFDDKQAKDSAKAARKTA